MLSMATSLALQAPSIAQNCPVSPAQRHGVRAPALPRAGQRSPPRRVRPPLRRRCWRARPSTGPPGSAVPGSRLRLRTGALHGSTAAPSLQRPLKVAAPWLSLRAGEADRLASSVAVLCHSQAHVLLQDGTRDLRGRQQGPQRLVLQERGQRQHGLQRELVVRAPLHQQRHQRLPLPAARRAQSCPMAGAAGSGKLQEDLAERAAAPRSFTCSRVCSAVCPSCAHQPPPAEERSAADCTTTPAAVPAPTARQLHTHAQAPCPICSSQAPRMTCSSGGPHRASLR